MMDYVSDSMNRVHSLFTVAKCFANKGVEKDDEPVWIAGTFSMLLDLIEEARDEATALIEKQAEALGACRSQTRR